MSQPEYVVSCGSELGGGFSGKLELLADRIKTRRKYLFLYERVEELLFEDLYSIIIQKPPFLGLGLKAGFIRFNKMTIKLHQETLPSTEHMCYNLSLTVKKK